MRTVSLSVISIHTCSSENTTSTSISDLHSFWESLNCFTSGRQSLFSYRKSIMLHAPSHIRRCSSLFSPIHSAAFLPKYSTMSPFSTFPLPYQRTFGVSFLVYLRTSSFRSVASLSRLIAKKPKSTVYPLLSKMEKLTLLHFNSTTFLFLHCLCFDFFKQFFGKFFCGHLAEFAGLAGTNG